jgi:alpha-beta hydrolase superfamily lysophospholipase
MRERITFETEDGVTIVGEHLAVAGATAAALLLHMMPADRSSWRRFAEVLANRGISSLAIDLRGHGESTRGKGMILDYASFSDEDHQRSSLDVDGAMRWLGARSGLPQGDIAVVGASIGSNLAIAFGAAHHDVPAVVALSPGLDYRGVTTEDKMPAFGRRPLLLVASDDDVYSSMTVEQLAALQPSAETRVLHDAGHGTAMFEAMPMLVEDVAEWLKEHVPGRG